MEARLAWRRGTDSVAGNDKGWDADLSLEWLFHRMEVRLTGRYTQFGSVYQINDSWLVYLQVRRVF